MQDWFSTINYLMIEANSQCNLRCVMCTREKLVQEGLRNPNLMTEEKLVFLLEQLKDCPIDTIKFEGLSEPFLHPYFARLCKLIKDYFPKAHLIIITNLQYSITKVDFREVCMFADAIYLSIDGTQGIFEELRAGAKWSICLKNLKYIKDNLPLSLKDKIFINFTASEKNFHELEKIYELKEQFELKGVRINLVQNWDGESTSTNQFSIEMMNYIRNYSEDLKGAKGWDFKDCFWPFNGLVIDVEGRIRQCILNTTQKSIGNAFETPLREIYNNNEFFLNIRKDLNNNICGETCENCDYKKLSTPLNNLFDSIEKLPRTKKEPYNLNEPF